MSQKNQTRKKNRSMSKSLYIHKDFNCQSDLILTKDLKWLNVSILANCIHQNSLLSKSQFYFFFLSSCMQKFHHLFEWY